MSFPVTVDLITQSAEAPGKYGPFLVGSNRYLVLITQIGPDGDGNYTPYLSAYKSTDGGQTWNEVDAGARPPGGNVSGSLGSPVSYTCVQSSTDHAKIYTLYVDPDVDQFAVVAFDASTDLWGVLLSDSGIGGNPPSSQMNQSFMAAVYRPDDTILLAFAGDTYTDASGEQHIITSLVSYDVTANTWGSQFDADYDDYGSVIGWHQVPCGMVIDAGGTAHLFTQQVTHAVPASVQNGVVGGAAPWYATTVDIECWGDGGGGASAVSAAAGGGGGAGAYASGSTGISGTFPSATIGPGGAGGVGGGSQPGTADGQDGSGTTCGGVTAAGGQGALADGSGNPGGNGGAGYVTGIPFPGGAGGGGGSDTAYGSGSAGSAGVVFDGTDGDPNGGNGGDPGPGGFGNGGAGGTYNPADFDGAFSEGGDGSQPGGGGGGAAIPSFAISPTLPNNGGPGGAGDVSLTYTPAQGTVYNSRLWQQAIAADNTLGTLQEIDDGEFPIQSYECFLALMPFDCAAHGSAIAICFSGAYNTTGYQNIEVMTGTAADPISFSATVFAPGGAGLQDPSAAACFDLTGGLYVAHMQIGASTVFVSRKGPGFGTASTYGTFGDPGCRVQAANFGSVAPEITFGVPSAAGEVWNPPE